MNTIYGKLGGASAVNTTDRELLAQALEALELEDMACRYEKEQTPSHIANTITALRERLAQPEQESVALPEKMYEFVPTPEPSKWHHPECEGQCIACLIEQVVQEAYGSQGLGYLQRHLTSPPQRKPLTDEQIVAKALHLSGLGTSPDVIQFARAIEDKLREKNYG